MNGRTILITLISILCRNNVLLGLNEKAVSNEFSKTTHHVVPMTDATPLSTLIPPDRCSVSLTVKPSPAILGSLITFYSKLNSSIIPPIEYQCCYYFWQDNISENVTMTDGLMGSRLPSIYKPKLVKKGKYIMEVTVCWQKILATTPPRDIQLSKCDYAVAVNSIIFELTDTLNGYLKFEQDRKYPGNPSVLMIGAEASAIFVPTDQRLEILTYKWSINASEYFSTNDSSILFTPMHVGIISVELHVSDRFSNKKGSFKHFIPCKEPILDAFIKGDEQLLVGKNGTFFLTYMGSGPFTFCWETDSSDFSGGSNCIYNLTIRDGDVAGCSVFYVQAGSESGQQKIVGNLTNEVSKMVLNYEFQVLPEVNIRSGVLVAILIVAVFMSSMLTYIICRKQPKRRQRLPVEVADFDFCPGIASHRRNSDIQVRIQQYWRLRIFPFLTRIKEFFKPNTRTQENYTPIGGSCLEGGSSASNSSRYNSVEVGRDDEQTNSSSSEDLHESLQMQRKNSDPGTPPLHNGGVVVQERQPHYN